MSETIQPLNNKVTAKPKKNNFAKRIFIVILAVIAFYGAYRLISSFLSNDNSSARAIIACENIYKNKVNNFSKQTGLNSANVVFNKPDIIKKQELLILSYNNISLGKQKDKFVCYFNLSNNKAFDRTPLPKWDR